jgi:hypothetical protein
VARHQATHGSVLVLAPPDAPSQPDRCPRCGASFGCEIAGGACWCAGLTLTPERRAELAAGFEGCLCPNCLRQLVERAG